MIPGTKFSTARNVVPIAFDSGVWRKRITSTHQQRWSKSGQLAPPLSQFLSRFGPMIFVLGFDDFDGATGGIVFPASGAFHRYSHPPQ